MVQHLSFQRRSGQTHHEIVDTTEASRRDRTILDPCRPIKRAQLSTAHKVGIEDTSLSAGYPCINILKDCRGRPFFRRVDLSPGICKSRFGTVASCCRFPGVAGFLKSARHEQKHQPSRHRHPKPTFFNENHRIKWSYSRAGKRYGWSSGTKTKQACPIRIGQSRKPSAARRRPKPKVSAGIWLQHVCRLVPWTYAKFPNKDKGGSQRSTTMSPSFVKPHGLINAGTSRRVHAR